MSAEIIHGDCLDVMSRLASESVDAVVTSPPYAEQRKAEYGGIPEHEYPDWTVAWMDAVRCALKPQSSVLVNIREHIRNGEMSDYVHRTRLAVRASGWIECDELVWVKGNAPPVGHPKRPRRSWERILWFSQSRQATCHPRANGKPTGRVGPVVSFRDGAWTYNRASAIAEEIPRCSDVASFSLRPVGEKHPASYPIDLAAWMVRLVTLRGDMVLDPFAGSASTGVACLGTGRRFVGIEREATYVDIARRRLADVQPDLTAA